MPPIATIVAAATSEMANHNGNEPWISLESASWWFDKSSVVLAATLFVGFICTVIIIVTGIAKEHHWDIARERASEKIAELNRGTARLQADNLALQTVMLPRHIGLIGLDEPPPALKWFEGLEAFAGTQVHIQPTSDVEAEALAKEIETILTWKGWKLQPTGYLKTGVHPLQITEGPNVWYPVGKPWTAEEPNQPWFAWKRAADGLANSLTRAGLGVGDKPISVTGFRNERPLIEGISPYFETSLTGVYLQVGARPISSTVQWIKQGRPNVLGEIPASTTDPSAHK